MDLNENAIKEAIENKKYEAGKIFSPTSPIKEKDFFYGRISQIDQVVRAVNQNGQHGIIYGERGVGKTSLANIICRSLTYLYPAKITCNKQDTFKSIWERILTKVQYSTTINGIGFKPNIGKQIISLGDSLKEKKDVNVADIEGILQNFPTDRFLFVFE